MTRATRAVVAAAMVVAASAAVSGCGLESAVGGEAPGAVIFDRPDAGPAREGAGVRLARLGRRLLDLARSTQQPAPLLFPDLHERTTLNGTD